MTRPLSGSPFKVVLPTNLFPGTSIELLTRMTLVLIGLWMLTRMKLCLLCLCVLSTDPRLSIETAELCVVLVVLLETAL